MKYQISEVKGKDMYGIQYGELIIELKCCKRKRG